MTGPKYGITKDILKDKKCPYKGQCLEDEYWFVNCGCYYDEVERREREKRLGLEEADREEGDGQGQGDRAEQAGGKVEEGVEKAVEDSGVRLVEAYVCPLCHTLIYKGPAK